jgi:hypothetical protein
MLAVSIVVLGLFYWPEGIDRRVAVLCLLLYVSTFFCCSGRVDPGPGTAAVVSSASFRPIPLRRARAARPVG